MAKGGTIGAKVPLQSDVSKRMIYSLIKQSRISRTIVAKSMISKLDAVMPIVYTLLLLYKYILFFYDYVYYSILLLLY